MGHGPPRRHHANPPIGWLKLRLNDKPQTKAEPTSVCYNRTSIISSVLRSTSYNIAVHLKNHVCVVFGDSLLPVSKAQQRGDQTDWKISVTRFFGEAGHAHPQPATRYFLLLLFRVKARVYAVRTRATALLVVGCVRGRRVGNRTNSTAVYAHTAERQIGLDVQGMLLGSSAGAAEVEDFGRDGRAGEPCGELC